MAIDLLLQRREMTAAEVRNFLHLSKARKLRDMHTWVKEELRLPPNPTNLERYYDTTQPAATLWLKAMPLPFRRRALTGCTQSGKTWNGLSFPALWHLFEMGQTGVYGVPIEDMAPIKWKTDLLPMIERSRYRELLPVRGSGSRGGNVKGGVKFQNGAILEFMSGRGSDATRSGFTAWWAVVTEVDKMDTAGGASEESDPIKQIEARGDSLRSAFRLYLECTVSHAEGRIWREITEGTNSRVAQHCQHCGEYVTLGRESLTGWQDAHTVMEARRGAAWVCPACGVVWSDDDRRRALLEAVMLHGEQEMRDGQVVGQVPETNTLGFRWCAADNLFWTAADVAEREWMGRREPDEENAERELCQFVWAVPPKESREDVAGLSIAQVQGRQNSLARGYCAEGDEYISAAMDIGHHLCHYVVVGWMGGNPHVIEYQRIETPSRELGPERGITNALEQFEALCETGWPQGREHVRPAVALIDARHQGETVFAWLAKVAQRGGKTQFLPSLGFGTTIYKGGGYEAPKALSKIVRHIGPGYHLEWRKNDRQLVVHANADHWKTEVQGRFIMPTTEPGALTVFRLDRETEHGTFARHITAERPIVEYVNGKEVHRFEAIRNANHWLDATYMALIAGHYAGEKGNEPGIITDWFARQRKERGK